MAIMHVFVQGINTTEGTYTGPKVMHIDSMGETRTGGGSSTVATGVTPSSTGEVAYAGAAPVMVSTGTLSNHFLAASCFDWNQDCTSVEKKHMPATVTRLC